VPHISLHRLSCFNSSGVTGAALAQDRDADGTITDATGGVLPGVTFTATHDATGNTFVAVSPIRAARFRLPVRTASTGHRRAARFRDRHPFAGLLVRQTAVLNLQLAPSAVQESVTVTGEAPLIDTVSSTAGATSIAPDARTCAQRPQLDRPDDARARRAAKTRRATRRWARRQFQHEHRRPGVTNNMVQSCRRPKLQPANDRRCCW